MRKPLVFTALLLVPYLLTAQHNSLFDFISKHEDVEIRIETDFRTLLKKKDEYNPAQITILSGEQVILDTIGEIRSRGNMRKQVCFMPPSKIRLDKKYLEGQGLETYPTLKIVNSCSFNNQAENYVQSELLAYKLYRTLTDKCFDTKGIRVHYIDSKEKKKPVAFEGFIIEHEDELADRLKGEIFEVEYANDKILDRKSYLLFSMFQYMIGNTDWAVLNKHNMEIVKVPEDKTLYPVAYDFDYAGLINTVYAVPQKGVPIENVRQRFYLGPCQSEEEVMEMRQFFLDKKAEIISLLDQHPMDERNLEGCRSYVQDFYEELENVKQCTFVYTHCRE